MLRPEWSMPSLFERQPERFALDDDPWAPKKKRQRKTAGVSGVKVERRPGLEREERGACVVLSLRDRDAWRKGRTSR